MWTFLIPAIRHTKYLYLHSIFSTCIALYNICKIVETLWCLLTYVVFVPKAVGKKWTTSAGTPYLVAPRSS